MGTPGSFADDCTMKPLRQRLTPAALKRRESRRIRRTRRQLGRALSESPCCAARFQGGTSSGLNVGAAWVCTQCRRAFTIAELEEHNRLDFPDRVEETRQLLGLDPPPVFRTFAERVADRLRLV
jgi:hypothetical protein